MLQSGGQSLGKHVREELQAKDTSTTNIKLLAV